MHKTPIKHKNEQGPNHNIYLIRDWNKEGIWRNFFNRLHISRRPLAILYLNQGIPAAGSQHILNTDNIGEHRANPAMIHLLDKEIRSAQAQSFGLFGDSSGGEPDDNAMSLRSPEEHT